MRISDWSSDVCSSDLGKPAGGRRLRSGKRPRIGRSQAAIAARHRSAERPRGHHRLEHLGFSDLVVPTRLPSRSEEHTSELQSLMRISYAVFCLKNKNKIMSLTFSSLLIDSVNSRL